jgi:hypothetical protein
MAIKQKFVTAYGEKTPLPVKEWPQSLTKQNHRDECNINYIVNKFQKTGVITHRNKYEGNYDDVTGVDFTTSMNMVKAGESMFAELPSAERRSFNNDPAKFMTWINNPENQDEMIKRGYATDNRIPEPIPIKVEVTNPPEPSSEPV